MSNPSLSQYSIARVLAEDPVLRERDERLEALKAVVGKLGHDFNNFLVPLLGYVTLLKEEIPQESGATQYANTLENAARKTESYLDSILLAMRPHRHFNPREIDLGELLKEEIRRWHQELPTTAQIRVEEKIQRALIMLDEAHWRSVIKALLSNARYALATGGTLTVTLENQTLTAAERKRLGVEAAQVHRLTIEDTGFGMDSETVRHVFEPFYTTRGGIKAAGLGLTMVHSVTQLQGGQVVLESTEDAGTKVMLWIPSTPPGIQINRQGSARLGGVKGPGSRILLVDDDPLIREVIRGALVKTGRDIFLASDGDEGLKIFNRYKNDWALIISDIMMPGTGGIALFQQIKEVSPDVRFMFLTGNLALTNQELMAQLGAEPPMVIRKPFTLKSFDDVVQTLLS